MRALPLIILLLAMPAHGQRLANATRDTLNLKVGWTNGIASLVIYPGQEINFGNWITACEASNPSGMVMVSGTGSADLVFCVNEQTGRLTVVTRSMAGDLWFFFAGFTLAVVLGLTGAMKRLLARSFDTSPEL